MSTLTYPQNLSTGTGRHTRAAAALAVAAGLALGVTFASTEATPTAAVEPARNGPTEVVSTIAPANSNTEAPVGMGGNLGPIHPD